MALTRKMKCTPWRRFQAGTIGAKVWRRLDSSTEQSHVAGPHMHRKLVMESERRGWGRGGSGSRSRSGKLCGLDPMGTGEPNKALGRALQITLRALLQDFEGVRL